MMPMKKLTFFIPSLIYEKPIFKLLANCCFPESRIRIQRIWNGSFCRKDIKKPVCIFPLKVVLASSARETSENVLDASICMIFLHNHVSAKKQISLPDPA